ncbi:hypothetical protein ZIOFF_060146 [Zingiber officinale]|uniref:RING-type domain-containing protein n=1 Tax=Zingiber officinale TaxID=94328 RepID=A0A8J5KNI1_ZINOF|nr:hypothetical protein ZIOFF_060146 [Zingiber officinale]
MLSDQGERIEKLEAMVLKLSGREFESEEKGSCSVKPQCLLDIKPEVECHRRLSNEALEEHDDDDVKFIEKDSTLQINAAEVSYKESSDMFDVTRDKGLLPNAIKRLPMFKISCDEIINSCGRNDFIDGDTARMMPMCNHIFHVVCIDVCLVKHDSCPTCRQEVLQFESLNFSYFYKVSVWLKE